jgi:acetylornithine deacetylase
MEYERPNRDDVTSLLSELVAMDSVNPSLVPGAQGEGAIAQFVAHWMTAEGLEVDVIEICPGRSNVIGHVRGRSGRRSLMLNAHMDTVGVTGMESPFQARIEGDRLYGRGAYDMKAGLTAIMLAGRSIARAGGAEGDLIIAAVMDEEYASLGTQAVLESVTTDGAVVTEPTGLRLCLAHKGFAWLAIETHGRAAHGSKPELGIDAIAHMGRFLVELEALRTSLAAGSAHPLVGTGSVHASLIEGGQELSSYPSRCRLQIERRTIPGETPEFVLQQVEALIDRLHRDDESFAANCELSFWRDPFEVAAGEEVVRAVQRAVTEVMGFTPAIYGDTPWMDAALLSAAGIPTVVFGPGGAGAHSITEYASLSEVELCAETLMRMTLDFCSGPTSNAGDAIR